MAPSTPPLQAYYASLFTAYGPQHWWPGDTPWEIACGAVLTQNTNWKNVEQAVEQLKSSHALSASAVVALAPELLAQLIRPAGYFNVKTKRLKNLAHWWLENDAPSGVANRPFKQLRHDLLAVNGIGPETADSILLYALGRATFVVDAYTKRILTRHGIVDESATYHEIKELFETELPKDQQLYNEYHALIVNLGKEHCKTKPQCEGCPLENMGAIPIATANFTSKILSQTIVKGIK